MLKIAHVPGARSIRPIWLCFELDVPVLVETVDFSSFGNSREWQEISPNGKIPAAIDDGVSLFESGAIVEYILERYGEGCLRPMPGTPSSAIYHQWCWFSEATLIRPIGLFRLLRTKEESVSDLITDAELKFRGALKLVEQALHGKCFLVNNEFTAADIMMGYSIMLIDHLLTDEYPNLKSYANRLRKRPAFQRTETLSLV